MMEEIDLCITIWFLLKRKNTKTSGMIFVSKANYAYLENPWDKSKLDQKLKAWDKETAGHTCYEDPYSRQSV